MKLTRAAVKRPIATCAILVVVLVIGTVSLIQSPLDLLPDIDPPVLAVVTVFPGSAPQETLDLVTEPIEDASSTVSGINNIYSISQESVSIVILQFSWGTDVSTLRDNLDTQLDIVSLPEGVYDTMIIEFDPTLMPIMSIALSGMEDLSSLSYEAENTIVPRLQALPGVATVGTRGTVQEDVFVHLSPEKVEEKNISFEMLSNIILASLQDVPAGIRDIDDKSMRLRFVGRSPDVEMVENLVVGFDMDEEALKRMVGEHIDIDLNAYLASAFDEAEAREPIDIPMRTITLDDVLDDIEVDEEEAQLIFTFPTDGEYGSPIELLALVANNTDDEILTYQEWEVYAALAAEFDEEGDAAIEDFNEEEIYAVEEEFPIDEDLSAVPNIPYPGEEPGQVIIPLSDDYSDITAEELGDIGLYEVPDIDQWTAQIEQTITGELDEASQVIEEAIVDLAVAYIMSQAGMSSDGGMGFEEEMDDLPLIPITLNSIAEVGIDTHEQNTITRINKNPSINISVQKEGDANTVAVARDVRSTMEEIADDFRDGNTARATASAAGDSEELFFNYPLDQGREIEIALMDLAWSLLGGAFLAIVVLIFFLKNWRTTLIIGLSIPTAIIFTFSILYFTDMTINLMTLGGLALAAVLLVDNAIVVSENVYRHMQMGKPPAQSSIDGASEVAAAITASTLTTLSVFFPVVFLTGIAGELFWEFAVVVSCALFASLVIALTVIPMLSSLFLRLSQSQKQPPQRQNYRFALNKAVKYRWLVILAAIFFLFGGVYTFQTLGTDLFPVPEESSFSIDINLPPGTTLSNTDSYVQELEDILEKHEEKFEFFSTEIGDAGFMGLGMGMDAGESNRASIRVRLEDDYVGEMTEIIEEVRGEAKNISDEAELSFNRETILDVSGMSMNLELDVIGDSVEKVTEISAEAVELLSEVDILSDIKSLMDDDRPELHINVDQRKALERGVTTAQAAMTIRQALEGKDVARLQTEDRIYDIILGYHKDELSTLDDIRNLGVYSEMMGYVPIKEIADIRESFGPLSIPRQNQQTIGQIQANFHGVDLDTASSEAMQALEELEKPEGYHIEPSGAFDMMVEAFDELELVLIIAAILVYLVMAAQFESLLHPFIIICSLPLAFTGAILALIVTGNNLSIPAMIGIIVLAGILVNDSIIMVDLINQYRRIHGYPLKKAIIEGATARMRPIIMVTITTILGLTPLAFGIGEGAELQAPMAITVIGGQITGTILLLVVVPAIYFTLTRSNNKGNNNPDDPNAPNTKSDINNPSPGKKDGVPSFEQNIEALSPQQNQENILSFEQNMERLSPKQRLEFLFNHNPGYIDEEIKDDYNNLEELFPRQYGDNISSFEQNIEELSPKQKLEYLMDDSPEKGNSSKTSPKNKMNIIIQPR